MISFLNPIALFFSLLSGVIVVMYLLKLRRKKETFSSTLLWTKSVEDLTANAPFQKLRQNLLMYLQILFLLLLVLALARPTIWLNRTRGVSRILLIDNSASMSATDGPGGTTRLDEAKQKAREMIQNMARTDQAMLISFGGAARTIQPFTSEKALLRSGLHRIETTDAPSRIKEAVLMAKGVIKSRKNSAITIISDGGKGYLGGLFTEDDPVEFVAVGSDDRNCGIVAFDLRQSFEEGSGVQLFAEVENFASEETAVLVRCVIDDEISQVREATIPAKSRQGFVFTGLEGGRHLQLELDGDDLLAADDVVHGFLNLTDKTEVLLVSDGNFFLEKLLGLLPSARVSKVSTADYQAGMATDVTVFDQFAPEQLGPGQFFFINAIPPFDGFSANETPLGKQNVLDWNRLHPVMRFVGLDDLALSESLHLLYPDWAVVLAESAKAPLILAGERHTTKLLAVAFDLFATNWPLQPSFPVFLSNAIHWLGGEGGGSLSKAYHTGETIALPATEDIRVTSPDGAVHALSPDDSQVAYFSATHRVGSYAVAKATDETPGATQHFAINLLSVEESDIAPKSEIVSGEKTVSATSVSKENREAWLWLLAAALLLLTIEWHLYCRRAML